MSLLSFSNLNAQVCGTSGLDGPQNAVPPVNTYFPLATNASLTAGSKSITLLGVPPNDPNYNLSYGVTPIRSGDLILIIQMQDAEANFTNSNLYGSGTTNSGPDNLGGTGYTNLGNVGKFEYVVATSDVALTGGLLEFRGAGAGGGAVNTYTNSNFTSARGQRRFQVVRVPQYSNLVLNSNITTPPYNGSVGGIIAFDVAGTMQFNGFFVDASQRGFRGGYGPVANSGTNTSANYAVLSSSTRSVGKGEGIVGTPRYMWDGFNQVDNIDEGLPNGSYGRGAPGNAGGAGNDHNSGGGGGGNAGFGGIGGRGWQGGNGDLNPLTGAGRPGSSIPLDYSRLIMGGGGGGGDANNATSGVKGGVGGGIILINVEKIDGFGIIRSNGGIGEPGVSGPSPDGAGGGGAGGSIFVRSLSASPTATLTIEARGGNGGNTRNDNNDAHGPGGGGGGGFILTQVASATINTNVTSGVAGRTNNGAGISHGATDGANGNASSFTTTNLPSHLQGGGSICYPILNVSLTEDNAGPLGARPAGSFATYKLRVTNSIGGGNAGDVNVDFILPNGFSLNSVSATLSGDTEGPTSPSFVSGSTGVISLGSYNISPGDYVEFTISVSISLSTPSGIYHASAQATYLDPTRTIANPLRKITANNNFFTGSNVTYETGGITNVPGTNYDGNLVSASVEDVYITAVPPLADCNAIINGDFGFGTAGTYNNQTYFGWEGVNSGDQVRIFNLLGLFQGALIKDTYSLKQNILSIKSNTNYQLRFSYARQFGCLTPSAAKITVRVLDANSLQVLGSQNYNGTLLSQNGSINFTTNAGTTALILEVVDNASPGGSCPVYIDDFVITSPLFTDFSNINVSCKGLNNGIISFTNLSNAAAPYQISYSTNLGIDYSSPVNSGIVNSSTAPLVFSNLAPGSYLFRISDQNGCLTYRTVTINEPDLLTATESQTTILCNGSTSTVTLTASGGTAPYQYSINGGLTFQTQNIFPSLNAGSYNFLIKDAQNCTTTITSNITQPSAINITESHTPILCFGGSSSVTLAASGGTGILTFSNDNLNYQTSGFFNGLNFGDHIFYVKDANGCIKSITINITQPAQVTLSGTATTIQCNGGTSTVTLNGVGGTGAYEYSLDGTNFQASSTFTNLIANTYTFTIKDANGCTDTETINITQPAQVTLSGTATTIQCNGGTSTVTLNGVGGTGAYEYSIDGTNFQASSTFINLTANNYTFTIRDASGCTDTETINITQPAQVTLSGTATTIQCNGGTSTVTLNGTGGTGAYEYSIDGTNFQASSTFTNLTANNYTFTIRDTNGCTDTETINITQPAILTLSGTATTIQCNGGTSTLTLNGAGGTGVYEYSVDGTNFQASSTFINLTANTYTFTIRDANGCIDTETINITQPAQVTLSGTATTIQCNGGTSTVTLNGAGGTGVYEYSVDGTNFQSSNIFANLAANSYTFTIKDANGCIDTEIINITQPAILTLSGTATTIQCNGGTSTVTLNGVGGTGAYEYSLDGTNFQASSTFTNLIANTYTFTIKDANGCTDTETINITQPAQVTLSGTATTIQCNGGTSTVTLNGVGGTGAYEYSIDGTNFQASSTFINLTANNYTFTIRDASGCTDTETINITQPAQVTLSGTATTIQCNGGTSTVTLNGTGGTGAYEYSIDGTNFQASSTFTNLTANNYTFTIRDTNGCTDTETINITQPAILTLSGTATTIQCNGGTSTLTLNGAGGTGVYEYSVDGTNFQASSTFINLTANTYTFTIRDANGCIDTETINITQPAQVTLSGTATTIQCNGGTSTVTLNGAGGTGVYEYSVDGTNFQSSNIFANLAANSYTFTIKDANGCIDTEIINITQPALLSVSESHVDTNCFGDSSGSININISGGTAPYSFTWSNGSTVLNQSNLQAGSYTISVTDANNCQTVQTITLVQPQNISISASRFNVKCFGEATGSINISVTGGTAPYTYAWSNGATTEDLTALIAGVYSLEVTDSKGCLAFANVTITQPANPISISETHINNTCFAENQGSIDLTLSGGVGPYIYSWSNGASSADINNLAPGNYTVTVTDANNCVATKTITITPLSPFVVTSTQTNLLCNSTATGEINLNLSGGTMPYIINWSNGATSASLQNLTAGTYTYIARDNNGCEISNSIVITEPPLLSITGVNSPILCNGDLSTVTLTSTGGTGAYQYSKDGTTFQSSNEFSNIAAGNYTFSVKDENNCIKTFSLTITEPALLTITGVNTPVLCNGDLSTVTLTSTGGTGAYQYSKDGTTFQSSNVFSNLAAGSYTFSVKDANNCIKTFPLAITEPPLLTITGANTPILCDGDLSTVMLTSTGGTGAYQYSKDGTTFQSSNEFSNLASGNYTFSVKDANNCIKTFPLTITEPALLTITGANTPILCNGDLSTVTLTSTGGTGAYQYSKDGTTFQSSNEFSNLAAGVYTFSVKDANNCIKSFPITIAEPALLTITGSNTPILCNRDLSTVTLTSAGGTGAYQYSKDGTTFQSSNIFSNLAAGVYTFSVRDENNCIKTFPLTITEPALLTITGSNSPILCNGDLSTVTLSGAGGTGAYQYSKDGSTFQSSNIFSSLSAGVYTFSVKDANNCIKTFPLTISEPALLTITGTSTPILCNGDLSTVTLTSTGGTGAYQYSKDGITFQSSNVFSNLAAGNYTFSVKDANNCIKTFPLTISEPPLLTITGTNSSILCNGDFSTVTLTSTGGTGTYQYSKDGTTFQSSNEFSNLVAGNYTFTVKDANNCIKTFPLTISEPPILTITGNNSPILCNGDLSTVTLTSTGGTGAYQYSKNGSTFQSSNVFSNLVAGNYTFTVKDANNCIKTFPISVTEPPLLTITGANTPILCNGDLSTVTLTSAGGTGAYQYSKDGSTFQSSNIFSNLATGVYTFSVKDANNCIKTFPLIITQPNALSATTSHQDVLCFGQATGSINISVSGGTVPYTYLWSNGANTKDISALIAGNYTVTVTDANQCKIVKTILISQPNAPLTITDTHQNIKCFGDASGSINISVSGGTAPYTYSWNNGATTEDISALIAGNYTLTVTDANNCSATRSIILNQPVSPLTASEIHQDVNCFGVANGSIDISVSGGTSPYRYVWNNNATSQDISSLLAGSYSVVITDANDCKTTLNITIQQPLAPLSIVENHQNIKCFGDASGLINISVSGGTAPYTYLWNNGVTTKDLNNIPAGAYSVVVTDAKGCTIGKQIQITQPVAPLNISATSVNVKCFGDLTGSIDISVSGGTAPYTYLWGNGNTTQDPNNLPAGTYSVTVTDANGCLANKQIQITQPTAPLTLSETHVNNVCFGDKIGSINVSVSGGTAPYTYKWKTGQTTQDLYNLAGGLYELTVTDANGCTKTISATILPLQAFVVTQSSQNVKCFNENTGSINLNLSGGEAPYNITWSNGATGSQISNLKAGNYTYTAVDAYGCAIQKTITITQPQALAATFNVTNTTCKFSPDGAIALNVTGGKAPYKYTWNGLDRGPNASLMNISSGIYVITITDANSCSIFVQAEVLPGNCAPSADNDKYTTNEDTPITIRTPGIIVNDADPDKDDLKIMLNSVRDPNETQAAVNGNNATIKTVNGGVVINNEGSFTYTPRKNFAGTERFVYKVSDGALLSNFATVTIEVLAVNDPPIAVNDNYTTPEDVPFDGTVIPNDSDPDADPLTYSLLGQPNNAVVSFNADGTFRFVPVLNFNGTITFDYQVCDPSGLCDTATVSVIVTPVNDPPVALDDNFKTQINLPFNNRVTNNDSDPDNDPLQYSALTQPANGTLIFNQNGTFVYTPRNGFKGTDTFTYRACDPSGLCDNATVTILVQPIVTVNLTPSIATIKEGEKISITAVLTESIFEDATVSLGFGGSAVNNSDYTLTGNFVTITIPAGETTTTQEFTINAINDALRDDGEQVFANVTATSTPYVLIGTGSVVDITDIYPTSVPLKPEENPDINPDPLVSPNRDGQGNDKFLIYNITKYPNNEVLIFNRWGNEVYKIEGYNNNDKAFEGVANVGILTNTNKELVDGVYFYVIYTTDTNGAKKINRGYLILKR